MENPQYLFQLTAADIAKMIAAGNARAGRGIKIDVVDGSMVISIDEKAMVDFMWCFVRSGMVHDGLSGAPCVVPSTIKEIRDNVSLDPNRYT